MRWTNMNEKEMIKAWAAEESSDSLTKEYLSMPDKEKESYWCEYDQKDDILEYTFDTIPELKSMLEKELEEDFYKDLIRPVAVASLKEKKLIIQPDVTKQAAASSLQQEDEFSIPDFVYRF
ncbi:MAG: hypothetical protein NC124_10470 [Clostridium sp.]|nr:hypothetical protein [Clostridium sp.]